MMSADSGLPVGALVLAAGLSSRMGQPKMVLPWGTAKVISHVVQTLLEGGVQQVVVVTGGARAAVENALSGLQEYQSGIVLAVFNPDYVNGEMLTSVQVGLRALQASEPAFACSAFLLALGDQPQMQSETVRDVIAAYRANAAPLVVPSFEMRRGHPWLIDQRLWPGLLAMSSPFTLRDFLNQNRTDIHYVNVRTSSIHADLDTPEDYDRQAPA
jgi:molybdenum cofactor cytidylyltransferase